MEYVVKQLLDFDDIDAFRDYIRTLFGKLDMSEELWKRTGTEYLPTLPSLKIILLSFRQTCLTITFAIITHKKAVRAVALTAFLLHLCKPVYLCKFSFCEVKAVKTAYVFRYLLRTACTDKHSSNSLVVKHP